MTELDARAKAAAHIASLIVRALGIHQSPGYQWTHEQIEEWYRSAARQLTDAGQFSEVNHFGVKRTMGGLVDFYVLTEPK